MKSVVFIKPELYGVKDVDDKYDDLNCKKDPSGILQYGSESIIAFKIGGHILRPKKQNRCHRDKKQYRFNIQNIHKAQVIQNAPHTVCNIETQNNKQKVPVESLGF